VIDAWHTLPPDIRTVILATSRPRDRDACYKKWRQRGRELMAAVCAEYPDITMINYHGSQDGPCRYFSLNSHGTRSARAASVSLFAVENAP